MARKSAAKACLWTLGLKFITQTFPDNEMAEQRFVKARQVDRARRPHCSDVYVQDPIGRRTMYRRNKANRCPIRFGIRRGTFKGSSSSGCDAWSNALYWQRMSSGPNDADLVATIAVKFPKT